MSKTNRSIRGMHDILPAATSDWQRLELLSQRLLESYGFQEIRTPMLERSEVFTRAIGQATDVVEKEMYSFSDRNGDNLSLRPEGTAGVVRAALQNGLLYGPVERLWYRGPMFRHERPQKGRTRQFHQIGAEVFGAAGPDVDAELLALGERLWRALGLSGIRLELNSLGNSEERAAYRQALVHYMHQHQSALDDDTARRLERNPLRVLDSKLPAIQELLQEAPVLSDYLGSESRDHFDRLRERLDRLGITYQVNPRLVRGLDYYCHTVFEWITTELGAQGTICAGGRYDGLIELQGGKPWPATGFAMGMERLVALMTQGQESGPKAVHAYLVLAGEAAQLEGAVIAERIRDAAPGLRLQTNASGGSFKAQFKRADRSGAALALILGEDELAAGTLAIKFLRQERAQETVALDQLSTWIRDWFQDTKQH
ncbi:MAG: histidine--tRNA ligase [Xanthomonadales bacterium]|nr:histidine--tRNA ligase [Xanthomonadales bacterium]